MTIELNQATSSFAAPREGSCGFFMKGLSATLRFVKRFLYSNMSSASSHDLGEKVLVPRKEMVITQAVVSSAQLNDSFEKLDNETDFAVDEVGSIASVNNDLIDPLASEQGLIYAIYNPNTETFSYLIGTHHSAVNAALHNRYLSSITAKCETVYTENGAAYLALTECDVFPEPISYDSVIENMVLQNHKELVALDRSLGIVDQMLAYKKKAEEQDREVSPFEQQLLLVYDPEDPDTIPEKFAPELVRVLENNHLASSLESWQEGNTTILAAKREDIAKFSAKYYQKMLLRREKAWVEELSDKLETSKTPICIAVGASHLVGEEGLVAELQKKGFQVFQTTFSECATDNFFSDD